MNSVQFENTSYFDISNRERLGYDFESLSYISPIFGDNLLAHMEEEISIGKFQTTLNSWQL